MDQLEEKNLFQSAEHLVFSSSSGAHELPDEHRDSYCCRYSTTASSNRNFLSQNSSPFSVPSSRCLESCVSFDFLFFCFPFSSMRGQAAPILVNAYRKSSILANFYTERQPRLIFSEFLTDRVREVAK